MQQTWWGWFEEKGSFYLEGAARDLDQGERIKEVLDAMPAELRAESLVWQVIQRISVTRNLPGNARG